MGKVAHQSAEGTDARWAMRQGREAISCDLAWGPCAKKLGCWGLVVWEETEGKGRSKHLGEREPAGGHARAREGRGPAGLGRGPTREKKTWEENRPRGKKRKEAWAAGRCSRLLWPTMGPFLGQNAGLEPDQK